MKEIKTERYKKIAQMQENPLVQKLRNLLDLKLRVEQQFDEAHMQMSSERPGARRGLLEEDGDYSEADFLPDDRPDDRLDETEERIEEISRHLTQIENSIEDLESQLSPEELAEFEPTERTEVYGPRGDGWSYE